MGGYSSDLNVEGSLEPLKGAWEAMRNMGFRDAEACIQALHNCDGNMSKAVELLMEKQDR